VVTALLLSLVAGWPLEAGASPPESRPHTLTVEARDLVAGTPVPDVAFELRVADEHKLRATTNASGIARFEFTLPESSSHRFFSIQAHREGLVPLASRWIHASSSPAPPDRLLFQMEKATTIRGRVVDQNNQPVSDAVVVVSAKKSYPKSQQWVDVNYETAKTDAKGLWSFTGVPEQPDSVELAAYHYLCLTEHGAFLPEPFKPLSPLRDGSAVLRLRRGTLVDGTVLSPEGRPVANAEVHYGEEAGYANAIPPLRTDSQGKFTLGIKPGAHATLVVRASGLAPALERMKVGEAALRVRVTLDRTHSLRGRIVDPAGKPVAHAWVSVYWSGADQSPRSSFGSAITHWLTTDDDGRFEWKEAPGSGVRADVHAGGFAGKENLALASDFDHKIVLIPPTTVKGRVVDRATGQPLPRFSLNLAAAWQPESPFIWQGGRDLEEAARRGPGWFEYTSSRPSHRFLVRVQAEGYLPEDSEPFSPEGTVHELTFRLTKAELIRGTVRNPDGSIARDGFVYLVPAHRDGWITYLDLRNDDVDEHERSSAVHAKIGADGHFSLPAQREDFALLALIGTGSLLVRKSDLHGADVLRLEPWAHVKGTMTLDGKPAANLELQSYDQDDSSPVEGEPRMVRRYQVKTDADGRFELPRVLPGSLTLAQWVPNGVNRRAWAVIRASLDVKSGQSYDLKIGTSGRIVTGRLVLPHADTWMIRKAEIVPSHAKSERSLASGLEILEGGQFRALDLKPGDYAMRIALHEPPPGDSCGWGRLLGQYEHKFTIPAGAGASDVALDLGTLEPISVGGRPLQVGDRAPDFAIKTLDGKNLMLADFRSRFVLLDFWASWCTPCLDEMPNLLAIKEQFAKDPRLVVMGVSLDERPRDAASSVKAHKLSWLQGLVGPDSPVVSAYGATAIPATFLISPDGRILAKDLRGEKTKAAVAEALKP
jgi:peroxiredoxin/protocatechuate 3,4-dioxygenase beta subunit